MTETICSTSGSPGTTKASLGAVWRLAGSVALLLLGIGVTAWIERSAWRQIGPLHDELAATRAEGFYLGVHLRAAIWRLDGRLLRFQLSENPAERDGFREEANRLRKRIAQSDPTMRTENERRLARWIGAEFESYLSHADEMLEKRIRGIRRDTAALVSEEITQKSGKLLGLCDALVEAQEASWDLVLGGAKESLGSLQSLLQMTAWTLAAFLVLSAVLIYVSLIAPLRTQLSASRDLIERQEKLASLGTLAAGVAHEIRNPLTAIKFRLFSLRNTLPEGWRENEDLQVIGNEIGRLDRIVKDFLQFARPSEPERTRVSSTELLREVRELLAPQISRQGLELCLDAPETNWLHADRQQIKQVLINLVQNAAESITGRGTIHLRTRSGAARLGSELAPVVIFEVSDTGQGIPPEVESRLFDPFFSTKEGGTGLGLPIAARIVEKHGGSIQYHTTRNRGTTVSVVLPRLTDDASQNTAD